MLKPLCFAAICAASPALAEIQVTFLEGAPKDRFIVSNASDCTLTSAQVTIDLNGSTAGLIFDVTASGQGVEVFQPFELVEGADTLVSLPQVMDGDRAVTLDIRQLGTGQQVAFTIDVDDTAGGREITVNGSEIDGAQVRVAHAGGMAEGPFTNASRATVTAPGCVS